MVNGDEHLLSADSHKLIEDWTNDIERAVDDIRANPSAYCLDSVENTYDVLEAVDADLGGFVFLVVFLKLLRIV